MKRAFLLVLFLPYLCCSQNIDSLKTLSSRERTDSIKAMLYYQIADAFWNYNIDSSIFYYTQSKITANRNQKDLIFKSLTNLGVIYLNESNYLKSQDCFSESLLIAKEKQDSLMIATAHSNMGNFYLQIELRDKAIFHLNAAVNFLNVNDNPNEAGKLYGRIGNFYLYQDFYKDAAIYYKKAIDYFNISKNLRGLIIATQNLGVIEKRQKNYAKAIEYYNSSLKSYESIGYEVGMGQCLANIGNIYTETREFDKALKNLNEALNIFKKTKQLTDEILCYTEIAEIYLIQKNYTLAAEVAYNAEILAQNLSENIGLRISIFHQLNKIYAGLGSINKAYQYLSKYTSLNDTLSKSQLNNKIESLRIQFEVEQKDRSLKLLTLENDLKDYQIKRKSLFQILYLLIIGFSVIIITALAFLFISKKRANMQLILKNNEILQQKEEIEAQREEIEAQRDDLEVQRRLAIQQRDEITKQKKNITDSILYASHIQTALLPNENEIKEIIPEGFVFYKPLDIVSGDFYWMNFVDNKKIVAVADCTGHGVPGAFMSVMGINFLNSLIIEQGKFDPSLILTDLNESVIKALSHADSHLQDKDGMDIAICCIDESSLVMNYCSAKVKVIIWREGEINFLETACHSIGKSPFFEQHRFETTEFQLVKGDVVYILTDGYTDQFGGANRTKFLMSRFKKLIQEIALLDMVMQQTIIDKTIIEWQGANPQIDDMLVVGFKV